MLLIIRMLCYYCCCCCGACHVNNNTNTNIKRKSVSSCAFPTVVADLMSNLKYVCDLVCQPERRVVFRYSYSVRMSVYVWCLCVRAYGCCYTTRLVYICWLFIFCFRIQPFSTATKAIKSFSVEELSQSSFFLQEWKKDQKKENDKNKIWRTNVF